VKRPTTFTFRVQRTGKFGIAVARCRVGAAPWLVYTTGSYFEAVDAAAAVFDFAERVRAPTSPLSARARVPFSGVDNLCRKLISGNALPQRPAALP